MVHAVPDSFWKMFREKQQELSAERARTDASGVIDWAAAAFLFFVVTYAVMLLLSMLPANPDGSIRAYFLVPTYAVLGTCAGVALKRRIFAQRAFRILSWVVLIYSIVLVFAVVLDRTLPLSE